MSGHLAVQVWRVLWLTRAATSHHQLVNESRMHQPLPFSSIDSQRVTENVSNLFDLPGSSLLPRNFEAESPSTPHSRRDELVVLYALPGRQARVKLDSKFGGRRLLTRDVADE